MPVLKCDKGQFVIECDPRELSRELLKEIALRAADELRRSGQELESGHRLNYAFAGFFAGCVVVGLGICAGLAIG